MPTPTPEIAITPNMALRLIAEGGCENFTSGSCVTAGNRHPLARYGADQWCHACIASTALGIDSDRSKQRKM